MQSAQEYLETQVMTASPHRLHLLVVEGAIRFARQALQAFESQDWEFLDLALSRSRACVTELIGGLNEDAAPDLVDSQKALFAYVYRCLALADPERNPQLIENAIRILDVHRQTWTELGERLADNSAAQIPAPHSRSWTT